MRASESLSPEVRAKSDAANMSAPPPGKRPSKRLAAARAALLTEIAAALAETAWARPEARKVIAALMQSTAKAQAPKPRKRRP
jgi:hypothetical protein